MKNKYYFGRRIALAGFIVVLSSFAFGDKKDAAINNGLEDGVYKIQGKSIVMEMEEGWILSISREEGVGIMLRNRNGSTEQIDLVQDKISKISHTRIVNDDKVYVVDKDGDGLPELEAIYSETGNLKSRENLTIKREK